MGSTQKPDERPEVVSTIRPPSILRTKHKPRWPSCSLQSRGQRSHWMRPSGSVCHQRAGVCDSGLLLRPPLHLDVGALDSALGAATFAFVRTCRGSLLMRPPLSGERGGRRIARRWRPHSRSFARTEAHCSCDPSSFHLLTV